MSFEKPVTYGLFGRKRTSVQIKLGGSVQRERAVQNEQYRGEERFNRGYQENEETVQFGSEDQEEFTADFSLGFSSEDQEGYRAEYQEECRSANQEEYIAEDHSEYRAEDHSEYSAEGQEPYRAEKEQFELPEQPCSDVTVILSQLKPIPISQIPHAMFDNPMPDISITKQNLKNSKKIRKSKKKSSSPKSNVNNRNKSLREELAEIEKKVRENIYVEKNIDGTKTYQCQLCQEIYFISQFVHFLIFETNLYQIFKREGVGGVE